MSFERFEILRSDASAFKIRRQNNLRGDGVKLFLPLLRLQSRITQHAFRDNAREALVEEVDRTAGGFRKLIGESHCLERLVAHVAVVMQREPDDEMNDLFLLDEIL